VYKSQIHGHVTSKNVWLFTFDCLYQRLIPEYQVRPFLLYFNSINHKVFLHGATAPSGPKPHHYPGSLSHSVTLHSVWIVWARDQPERRDLYLTTHNTHKKEISMHPSGLETAMLASERPKIHALESAATGISSLMNTSMYTKKNPGYIKDYNRCRIMPIYCLVL